MTGIADRAHQAKLHGEVLYGSREVSEKIAGLASRLAGRYQNGERPLFVALMRGAAPFAGQLMRAIVEVDPTFHPEIDYMTVSTYGRGRRAGKPQLKLDIDRDRTVVAGRPVVLLDDIVERGLTLAFAANHLLGRKHRAASVDAAVLATKQCTRDPSFSLFRGDIDACFTVPDVWVTGMGLDDASVGDEGNRWLPYVAVANPAPIEIPVVSESPLGLGQRVLARMQGL